MLMLAEFVMVSATDCSRPLSPPTKNNKAEVIAPATDGFQALPLDPIYTHPPTHPSTNPPIHQPNRPPALEEHFNFISILD